MDAGSLTAWFDAYVERFAAVGRGEREVSSVVDSYAVPLLVTKDDQVAALTSREQVLAVVGSQVEGMRSEGYARTDMLSVQHQLISRTTAVLQGSFVRKRSDGSVIAEHTATYVITDSEGDVRIAALCLHGG